MKNKLLLIALVALLSSCVGQRGAMKYYLKHNDQLAELCTAKFPVKERIAPGTPRIERDTFYTPGPTLPCPDVIDSTTGKKTTPAVKCPDTRTVENKITVRDTIYKEDAAKLTALKNSSEKALADLQAKHQAELTAKSTLQGELNSSKKDLEKVQKELTQSKWGLRITLGLCIGLGFLYFKK